MLREPPIGVAGAEAAAGEAEEKRPADDAEDEERTRPEARHSPGDPVGDLGDPARDAEAPVDRPEEAGDEQAEQGAADEPVGALGEEVGHRSSVTIAF